MFMYIHFDSFIRLYFILQFHTTSLQLSLWLWFWLFVGFWFVLCYYPANSTPITLNLFEMLSLYMLLCLFLFWDVNPGSACHPWKCSKTMQWHTHNSMIIGFLRGGVVIPLIFPKVPQSSLGILRVPQLPPPLEHLPLKNPITWYPCTPPRCQGILYLHGRGILLRGRVGR